MLDFNLSEMAVVAVIALVVIGPKDLPAALRVVGRWVGRARGVARQFRSGFDTMVREAELEEMERKWAEENARIMREHPATPDVAPDGDPSAEPDDVAAERLADAHADAGGHERDAAERDAGGPQPQMTPRP